jgi:hypothetical protein
LLNSSFRPNRRRNSSQSSSRVVEPQLLVDTINLGDILLWQLEVAFEIGLHAAIGLALGDDRMPLRNAPRQRHLRTRLAVLLADLDKHRVIHELAHVLSTIVNLVLIAEGRVVRYVYALLLVEVRGGVLLHVQMKLDLVHGRYNRRLLDQSLELRFAKVRHANRTRLAAVEALLHRLVCVDIVAIAGLDLAVAVFGERLVPAGEWRGPVHEV